MVMKRRKILKIIGWVIMMIGCITGIINYFINNEREIFEISLFIWIIGFAIFLYPKCEETWEGDL